MCLCDLYMKQNYSVHCNLGLKQIFHFVYTQVNFRVHPGVFLPGAIDIKAENSWNLEFQICNFSKKVELQQTNTYLTTIESLLGS